MATLENVQGSSLVPNVGNAFELLFKRQAGQRDRERLELEKQRFEAEGAETAAGVERQGQATQAVGDILEPGISSSEAFKRLVKWTPVLGQKVANSVREALESGDTARLEALDLEADTGARDAFKVESQPDLPSKRRVLTEMLSEKLLKGEDTARLEKLLQMDEEQLGLELQSMTVSAEIIRENVAERLKPVEPRTDIGKARKDLKEGFISQKDFNTLRKANGEFKTSIGKLIGDKQLAIDIYGAGSEQVKFIDEAIASEGKGDVPKLSDVAGIRKEFTKLSGPFIELRDAIGKVEQSGKTPTPAGDLALIFNFMRILDPTSVVRESEFKTAQNATSLPGQLGGAAQKVVDGKKLLPAQRQDFIDTANRIFSEQQKQQRKLEESFRTIAERQGMDPENVIVNFGDFVPAAPAQAAPNAQGVIPAPPSVQDEGNEFSEVLKGNP